MYNDLAAILKAKGYSLTKPRKAVFELMYNAGPQTMQELVSHAASKVDRATVYRVIELFEKLGIAHRLNIGFKYKIELSDVFRGHHHHFYCTNCGQTYKLANNPMLETMIDSTVAKEGL